MDFIFAKSSFEFGKVSIVYGTRQCRVWYFILQFGNKQLPFVIDISQ